MKNGMNWAIVVAALGSGFAVTYAGNWIPLFTLIIGLGAIYTVYGCFKLAMVILGAMLIKERQEGFADGYAAGTDANQWLDDYDQTRGEHAA